MRAVPLHIVLVMLVACASNPPSIQDSINATARIVQTIAESTQAAYEAGEITDEKRQEIRVTLQQAQDYIRAANRAFADHNPSGASNNLASALEFIEVAQMIRASL